MGGTCGVWSDQRTARLVWLLKMLFIMHMFIYSRSLTTAAPPHPKEEQQQQHARVTHNCALFLPR
jgi:hypothetical protein